MHRLVVIGLPEGVLEFFEEPEQKRVSLLGPVECQASPVVIYFVKDVF